MVSNTLPLVIIVYSFSQVPRHISKLHQHATQDIYRRDDLINMSHIIRPGHQSLPNHPKTPSTILQSIVALPRIIIGRSADQVVRRQLLTNSPNSSSADGSNFEFSVAVLIPFFGELPFTLEKSYGTLLLALRAATKVLGTVAKIDLIITDSGADDSGSFMYSRCAEEFTAYRLSKLYFKQKVSAFIGPVCLTEFFSASFLASRWGLPIITPMGPYLNNKLIWPTAVRTSWSVYDVVNALNAILERFSWTNYFLIYEVEEYPIVENLGIQILTYTKLQPVSYMTISLENPNSNFLLQLMSGSLMARVFVLETKYPTKKMLLLNAYDLGLLQGGDYVFITTELYECSCFKGSLFDLSGERIEDLKKAYESVILVTIRTSEDPKVVKFKETLKNLTAQLNDFNFFFGREDVNPIIMGFYNALLVYASTLKRHIEEQGNPYNGFSMVNKMCNQTFTGDFGKVDITTSGDQDFEFTLWDFDPKIDNWVPVMFYDSKNKLYDVEGKSMQWPQRGVIAPLNEPACGYKDDNPNCVPREPLSPLAIVAIILVSLVLLALIVAGILYRKMKYEAALMDRWWEAHLEDIKMIEGEKSQISTNKLSKTDLLDVKDDIEPRDVDNLITPSPFTALRLHGEYRGIQVSVQEVRVDKRLHINRQILIELQMIREVQHTNLCRFVSISFNPPQLFVLMEYCSKGTLKDIIGNKAFKMDMGMKTSLIRDIASGMTYLHSTPIKFHGDLRSSQCFIDSRFSIKISGYGLHYIRSHEIEDNTESYEYFEKRLYVAPELLRMSWSSQGSQKGDVYSFAIILQEILLRCPPYQVSSDHNARASCITQPRAIIEKVKGGYEIPFRPLLEGSVDTPKELLTLIQNCWAESAEYRPTFQQIRNFLMKMNKGKEENVVDNLLNRMEMYTNNLESLVEERTGAYLEQKKKADDLLYQIMPKPIAEKLKLGHSIEPEAYDSVTIFFSDIVGFATMASESTPFEVVTFLNDLYTCMDNIIPYFDVYKVETIGDSYMVVSGAPVQNGTDHAREIARMSLALLEAIKNSTIRHAPGQEVKLRIGMHSGPVAAGVVGLKMPRYCLFGDTVNTSSRMESNGQALKIHVSPYTKTLLDNFGTFELQYRGEIQMKGKGVMNTYWLVGERDKNGDLITYNLVTLERISAGIEVVEKRQSTVKMADIVENKIENLGTKNVNKMAACSVDILLPVESVQNAVPEKETISSNLISFKRVSDRIRKKFGGKLSTVSV